MFSAAKAAFEVSGDPFAGVRQKSTTRDSAPRSPYRLVEIEALLKLAADEDEVGPVVIAAATTGMRRRDCAALKWKDVDLAAGTVLTRAHKTGKKLCIPIFTPLRIALEKAGKKRHPVYCFPEAAEMLESNPDGLNHRLKKLLFAAGIADRRGEVEHPEGRLRKAPGLGFHNFKAAFVTIALHAGVPVEMIKKITGNVVSNVLENHYYLPDAAEVGSMLRAKMPSAMTGSGAADSKVGSQSNAGLRKTLLPIYALVEAITPESALTSRAALLEALDGLTASATVEANCSQAPLKEGHGLV